MRYLLDTDILVDHLRGKKSLSDQFFKEGCAVSVITKGELFYGAYKSNQPRKNLAIVKAFLKELPIEVVPLKDDILQIFGQLKARLERKGRRLADFDLLIAATALSRNLTLITKNIRHYQLIPRLVIADKVG